MEGNKWADHLSECAYEIPRSIPRLPLDAIFSAAYKKSILYIDWFVHIWFIDKYVIDYLFPDSKPTLYI